MYQHSKSIPRLPKETLLLTHCAQLVQTMKVSVVNYTWLLNFLLLSFFPCLYWVRRIWAFLITVAETHSSLLLDWLFGRDSEVHPIEENRPSFTGRKQTFLRWWAHHLSILYTFLPLHTLSNLDKKHCLFSVTCGRAVLIAFHTLFIEFF